MDVGWLWVLQISLIYTPTFDFSLPIGSLLRAGPRQSPPPAPRCFGGAHTGGLHSIKRAIYACFAALIKRAAPCALVSCMGAQPYLIFVWLCTRGVVAGRGRVGTGQTGS